MVRERDYARLERRMQKKGKKASALGVKMDPHTVYQRKQKQTKQVTYVSASVHKPLACRAANCTQNDIILLCLNLAEFKFTYLIRLS